ncbi:MAG: Fic family protein [Bacteroidetes bacterium]|nr:Fic family protein [Bacteroidota bacterium]
MNNKRFSQEVHVFHGRIAPEKATLVGYGAIIERLKLAVPFPQRLSLISNKRHSYETEEWKVFSSRNTFENTLLKHIVFALKYEGINLLFFKKLFEKISKKEVITLILMEYTSQYMRRVWFLYEWLMQDKLPIADLKIKGFIPLIDDEMQYVSPVSINSGRHRIKNNLPGTFGFCPLIYKTPKLESFISENLSEKTRNVLKGIHKDILLRTSAFLLLQDSKASFSIERENPTPNRAVRWGRVIGQAGSKSLSKEELLRLQQIVLENSKFVHMGYRTEGGFIGEHDRTTGEPIPEHVSARYQDVESLMSGLLETVKQMENDQYHPVLAAASIAFGFVFIHPFTDGNGRLHRYLIHHILSMMKFTPQGIIFPVSAAILKRIDDYRKLLENYSHPLLDFIRWKKTPDNNVEVLNETIDYYRYFDATTLAEFLFESVDHTLKITIPAEVVYMQKFDAMKVWLDDRFQMPDKMIALLIRFLEQNNGSLSKRAKEKEFAGLSDQEAKEIEEKYKMIFN